MHVGGDRHSLHRVDCCVGTFRDHGDQSFAEPDPQAFRPQVGGDFCS